MKWELKGHSHQIADTGDYDGFYEITNGKISILSKNDDEEALQPIVDALNESECDLYLDDAKDVEIYCLKYEIEQLKQQLSESLPGKEEGLAETIKNEKSKLIWAMIEEWQDAREPGENLNERRWSFADIEADLYEWLEKIDPKTLPQSPKS